MTGLEPGFEAEVLAESGVDFRKCMLCGACASGCPVSGALDYQPHQIAYMIRLGKREEVLSSRAIWLCSTCYLCQERCQKGVKLTDLMLYLCRLATKERGLSKRAKAIVDSVRKYGRVSEAKLALAEWGLAGALKHVGVAAALARKGKLPLRVKPAANREAIAALVDAARCEAL